MTNTTTPQEAAMTATTPVRYTIERFDNGWHVCGTDDSIVPVTSRQAGRELAKQLREQAEAAPAPEAAEGGPVTTAAPAAAAKHQRTTLARVKVGDRLMTKLVTDVVGTPTLALPHRFSDGQVRTVAEVTTRKAGDGEMPGTLYTLVFEDGTCSEERYGTASQYPAEAFTGEPAPEAPAPAPAEKPAKKAPAPKIATTPSRAGKLVKGSRLALRDVGVVTVNGVSKTGGGKLEVAFTTDDGEAGVREMWASTNVRIA